MMNEVMWAAGMTTVTQCYSVRGLDVVAGLNIASTITNLFNIVYLQLGSCISIVVGQYLGAGKLKEAKDADDKMIVFSVFCCVIMAALMFVVGGFFPGIYNTSEEIKGLATQFIAVSAIIMPFCAFSHASYFTLRSGGKTGGNVFVVPCLPGDRGTCSLSAGTLYRAGDRKHLFPGAGYGDDQGHHRLLHGEE